MAEENPKKLESSRIDKVAGGKNDGGELMKCPWCHEWFNNDEYYFKHIKYCVYNPDNLHHSSSDDEFDYYKI